MKLGIMQAYFFPYIGYFQLIDSVDVFMLYEHVSFRKKSWITRNKILDKGKTEPIYISVPVINQSSHKLISEINIFEDEKWRSKILNLIYYNYKKAPFFETVFPLIKDLIYINEKSIHNYNSKILIRLCEYLDISTKIVYNNKFAIEEEIKKSKSQIEKKTNRIFKIAETMNSNHIVNAIGGKELYDKNLFKNNGLKINFVSTSKYEYKQFEDKFWPNLSIVDMMMHLDKEDLKHIIKNYQLV